MPTPAERQGLLFLAIVLTLGTGVRVLRWRSPVPPPTARRALAGQLAAVDSAIAVRGREPRRPPATPRSAPSTFSAPRRPTSAALSVGRPSSPVAPGGTRIGAIDLDTAPESVLVDLPGVGAVLARRIREDRDRQGPFGSLQAFQRVAGIGERTAARLAPHVTFSTAPRRLP